MITIACLKNPRLPLDPAGQKKSPKQKTCEAPKKMVMFSIFRGYVSFREGIYLHEWLISMVNVGKYISPICLVSMVVEMVPLKGGR